MTPKTAETVLDLLALALPYVEDAESDPVYKPGAVRKLTNRIRAAIAQAEAEERA